MDTNFWYFIAGLACCIPLSIAGNLLTKKYERWSDKRGIARSKRRTKKLREEYQIAKWYAGRPQRLTEYLLRQVMSTLLWLTQFILLSFIGTLLPMSYRIRYGTRDIPLSVMLMAKGAMFLAALSAIIYGMRYMHVLGLYYRVHCFPDYRKSVIEMLGQSVDADDPDAEPVEQISK